MIHIGNNFPVMLQLSRDGTIAFIPTQNILSGAIVDQCDYEQFPNGVSAVFDSDGLNLQKGIDLEGNIDYNHKYAYHVGYPYKTMEVLKEWLLQQRLFFPN